MADGRLSSDPQAPGTGMLRPSISSFFLLILPLLPPCISLRILTPVCPIVEIFIKTRNPGGLLYTSHVLHCPPACFFIFSLLFSVPFRAFAVSLLTLMALFRSHLVSSISVPSPKCHVWDIGLPTLGLCAPSAPMCTLLSN